MLNEMCLDCKKLNNGCNGTECQTWTGCVYKEKDEGICLKSISSKQIKWRDKETTLGNFLKLHRDGRAMDCVSVHQLPYSHRKHGYTRTYFEEVSQEEVKRSEIWKQIRGMQVDHFNICGGEIYPVELCVYLTREE